MRGLRALALACMVIVPSAVIYDDLVRFALSAEAHRCCASTGGACAGLSTPDDCCRTQQQATSQGYASIAPDSRPGVELDMADAQPTVVLPHFLPGVQPPGLLDSRDAFKRPHDPPHLHSFPLLI